jgi:hypothetical protein
MERTFACGRVSINPHRSHAIVRSRGGSGTKLMPEGLRLRIDKPYSKMLEILKLRLDPGRRFARDLELRHEPRGVEPAGGSGRSAINRRHDPVGVTLPRDFSRRQSVVEHLYLCGIKLDGLGGHVLFKIFPALGAGDRHDVLALVQ